MIWLHPPVYATALSLTSKVEFQNLFVAEGFLVLIGCPGQVGYVCIRDIRSADKSGSGSVEGRVLALSEKSDSADGEN